MPQVHPTTNPNIPTNWIPHVVLATAQDPCVDNWSNGSLIAKDRKMKNRILRTQRNMAAAPSGTTGIGNPHIKTIVSKDVC